MNVYRLTHEYFDEQKDYDIVTYIAVYSSKEMAESALEKFKKHPKFSSYPDGFCIDEYEVDKPNWKEGFVPF
jgi:hypothetical protein